MSPTENASPPGRKSTKAMDEDKTERRMAWNGSGGSAVVIASQDAKDVMRKLLAMEKIFVKKQEKEGWWLVISD